MKTNLKIKTLAVVLVACFTTNQANAFDWNNLDSGSFDFEETTVYEETVFYKRTVQYRDSIAFDYADSFGFEAETHRNNCAYSAHINNRANEARSRARASAIKARKAQRRARHVNDPVVRNSYIRSARSFARSHESYNNTAARLDHQASAFDCF